MMGLQEARDAQGVEYMDPIAVEEEITRMLDEDRAVFWQPNGATVEFIEMIEEIMSRPGGEEMIPLIMWSAANGVGKTNFLGHLIKTLVHGPQNEYFEAWTWLEKLPSPLKIRMICSAKGLEEGIIKELKRLFSKEEMVHGYPKKEGYNYEAKWRFVNPATGKEVAELDLLTWDQGLGAHVAATVHVLILDEPGPEKIFIEAIGRLRFGGPVIWTLTPATDEASRVNDIAWLYRMILDGLDGQMDVHVKYSDAEVNCREHGIDGKLPHAAILAKARLYRNNPAALKARLLGQFIQAEGLAYGTFDKKVHVVTPYPVPSYWPAFAALDHHPKLPDYYLYGRLSPAGRFIVTHELILHGLVPKCAEEIRQLHMVYGAPKLALIDPLSTTPNPITGTSAYDTYREEGLTFRSAGPEKADKPLGVERVNQRLEGVGGEIMLEVFSTCIALISEFTRLMIDPKTGLPAKDNDHMTENLYRICLNLPLLGQVQRQAIRAHQERAYQSSLVIPEGASIHG